MSVAVQSVDREELPDVLLSLTKSHMRVDHSTDDDYILTCIARAIARFESTNGATLNPTTVIWTPVTAEFCNGGATLPVRPVTSFTAAAGSPAADVSANYSIVLKWDDIYGIPIQLLKGAAATGLTVTLEAGFTEDTLRPEVLDVVLRHAAHLYEHREILLPGSAYVAPDLQLDSTWWMPRL